VKVVLFVVSVFGRKRERSQLGPVMSDPAAPDADSSQNWDARNAVARQRLEVQS
jgi:hypothetical protein